MDNLSLCPVDRQDWNSFSRYFVSPKQGRNANSCIILNVLSVIESKVSNNTNYRPLYCYCVVLFKCKVRNYCMYWNNCNPTMHCEKYWTSVLWCYFFILFLYIKLAVFRSHLLWQCLIFLHLTSNNWPLWSRRIKLAYYCLSIWWKCSKPLYPF